MTTTERPPIEELSEDRCWELLEQQSIGRLAVAVMNRPDIFPVNYRLGDRTIVVRTAPGQKLAAAVLGTAVAFEVDALDNSNEVGWSVVVKGTADEPVKIEDYLGAKDLGIEPWASGEKSRYLIIAPTEVTGREIPISQPTDPR